MTTTDYILLNDELRASNYDKFEHTFGIGLHLAPDCDERANGILFHSEKEIFAAICEWSSDEIAWVGVVTLCKRSSVLYVSDTTRQTDVCVVSKLIPFNKFLSKHRLHTNITVAMVEKTPRLLQFVDSEKQTTELCLAAVRKDGDTIRWIAQPTLDICLAAVRQSADAMKYIHCALFPDANRIIQTALAKKYTAFYDIPISQRTAEVCWMGLKASASLITSVPTDIQTQEMWEFAIRQQPALVENLHGFRLNKYELYRIALQQDGLLLKYVRPSQTRELCELAVQQNGDALEFVWKSYRTPELCMLAVKSKGMGKAVYWVPDEERTPELERAAVERNSYAIEWVTEQTPELCRLALDSKNPDIFKYVKQQTPELCEHAIRCNPAAIQRVREPTLELCRLVLQHPQGLYSLLPAQFRTADMSLYAVQQDGLALAWVPNAHKTPELLMAAVRQNGRALSNIPVKNQTPELLMAAAIEPVL